MSASALPRAAGGLVPHRSPMLMLSRLVSVQSGDKRSAVAEATVAPDCPALSLGEGGTACLVQEALVELMAQAFAAAVGHERETAGGPPLQGMLVGLRQVRFSRQAPPAVAGDVLEVRVAETGGFGDFAIVEGSVHRQHEVLGSAELKLYLQNEQEDVV